MGEVRHRRIRFGPFEADLAAGELRKEDRPVRLQEQPFQVLAALLDRSGEIVTREELRARLWPSDNFGDFDQGLNTAINKLREALGDSAANPQFVETVPKRGYRFMHFIETEPTTSNGENVRKPQKRSSKRGRFLMIAGSVAIAAAVLAALSIRRIPRDPQLPLRRFAIPARFPNISTQDAQLVAISPHGRHIAYIAGEGPSKLWIQDLDQRQPRQVEGSEGALGPFWSPDSGAIGFFTAAKVHRVSVTGAPVISLCDLPGITGISGGSWSPDGTSIVFTSGGPTALYEVAATGGTARLVVSPQTVGKDPGVPTALSGLRSGWIKQPNFLPTNDDQSVVFFDYMNSIVARDLRTGRHYFLGRDFLGRGTGPVYSPTGHLIYRSGTDLWARRFSPRQMRFEGEAFLVAPNASDASVSNDGTLVYRDRTTSQLVWFDRRGARIGTIAPPVEGVWYPALSPDGRRVAIHTLEAGSIDIWVSDVMRGTRFRLSSHPAMELLPVWAPGGDEVAFNSYRAGNTDIFVRRVDAGSTEIQLTSALQNERVSDWSRDGQYILYSLADPKSGLDLWFLKRNSQGEWEPHPLLQTPSHEKAPKLSPDNRYVAYLSDDSGRNELYVRQFMTGGRTWPVSSQGATQFRWSRSGRELFYVENGTLMAVSVQTGAEFEVGNASRLFSHDAFTAWADANYDVSPDGRRIILPERVGTQEPMIRVVQNWLAEFRDR